MNKLCSYIFLFDISLKKLFYFVLFSKKLVKKVVETRIRNKNVTRGDVI